MKSNDSGPQKATDRTALYIELPGDMAATDFKQLLAGRVSDLESLYVERTTVRTDRGEEIVTDGGVDEYRDGEDDSEPEVLLSVGAPEGHSCDLWSIDDGENTPSPCNNDADYLFVYEASTRPDDDRRRNALGCGHCFTPHQQTFVEEVDSQ